MMEVNGLAQGQALTKCSTECRLLPGTILGASMPRGTRQSAYIAVRRNRQETNECSISGC